MDSNETQTDDGVTDVENIASDNVNNNNDANNNDDDTNIDGKGLSEDFFEKKDIRSKAFIGVPIAFLGTEMINILATKSVPLNFLPYVRHASSVDLVLFVTLTSLVSSLAFLYGIIIDVFPICGLSWKSYAILGNIMMCSVMIVIAAYGDGIDTHTYILLTGAITLGIEITFTAMQGYIPFVTKRERPENKGYFQSVILQAKYVGTFLALIVALICFSGPLYTPACIGYEKDPSVPCSTEQHILNQNSLSQDNPDNWCHECPTALFTFDASLRQMYVGFVGIILLLTLPSILFLKEGKKVTGHFQSKIKNTWMALTQRSLWQMVLFTLVFTISFMVKNPSEDLMYISLLQVSATDSTIVRIIAILVAIVFIYLYMRFGLKVSRRKFLLGVILLVIIFDLIKLVPVYNVNRSQAIYYFIEAPSDLYIVIPMVIVLNAVNGTIEPGQETTVHALIMSCSHFGTAVASGVIAKTLLAFFPSIADAGIISEDTPEMKNDFAQFTIITVCFKFLAIYSLPMLPRQEKETRAIYEKKEQSIVWATVTVVSFIVAFLYTSVAIFVPIQSVAFLYTVLAIATIWCISIPACVIYWPIFAKKEKFDWKIFI